MAFSITRFTRSEKRKIWNKSFETVVDPEELRIPLPANFFNLWRFELEKNDCYWISSGVHCVEVSLHLSRSCNYLTSGKVVSEEFAFSQPTRVLFSYNSKSNDFMMKVLGKVIEHGNKEIISVDSGDDESFDEKHDFVNLSGVKDKSDAKKPLIDKVPGSKRNFNESNPIRGKTGAKLGDIDPLSCKLDGVFGWKMRVTAAAANSGKLQVLHFPKKVVRNALDKKQRSILVQTKRHGEWFNCRILTAKRNKFEKYISKDWRQIMENISAKAGDIIIFRLTKSAKRMLVHTIHF
ncbi:unnamed protein product [Trifolium pratense]|uniref:Uncharacterized protein n=1 Tax=Trifolium pratense TaxID=57577 RepID=A0ACB0K8S4_TRIPR|nr:unnamed protein product [Trifolium pratense]